MNTMSKKWSLRYLEMAKLVSSWSKDPRKQVGAVITDGRYVRGVGFNGFPRGVEDDPERLDTPELKLKLIIHAEVNALIAAEGKGDTIYIYPCLPCTHCLGQIIQYGVKSVVSLEPRAEGTKWDTDLVMIIAKEAGVRVRLLDGSILFSADHS